jgi:nucleotide-binding universal stress UspA family protein
MTEDGQKQKQRSMNSKANERKSKGKLESVEDQLGKYGYKNVKEATDDGEKRREELIKLEDEIDSVLVEVEEFLRGFE